MTAIILLFAFGVICAWAFDKHFIQSKKSYELESSQVVQVLKESDRYESYRKIKKVSDDRSFHRGIDHNSSVEQLGDGRNGGEVLQINSRG